MDPETQRAEAERWLGIAAKLMAARDLIGSKTFAIRARDADPNNGVSEQILAIVDTVLAGEKRVNASQQPDWYSILQLPKLVRDPDLIADHYRRLVFCLNPERNSFPFADYALQLVMDAWSVLSDPTKKWLFDNELALFLQQPQHHEQQHPPPPQPPATATASGGGGGSSGSGGGGGQLNTFQFFQPQPQQLSQQQQPPPPPPQQPPPQQQPQPPLQQPMWRQQQQQINQREFMSQVTQQQVPPPQVTQQQVPPQWQMRDPTPSKGGGGVIGVTQATPMIPTQTTVSRAVPIPTQSTGARSMPLPTQATAARASPMSPPMSSPMSSGRVTVAATTVVDGNAGNVPISAAATINDNNNNTVNVNVNVNGVGNAVVEEEEAEAEAEEEEEEEEGDVVEEVESFWTACPYCLYIFEYQKVYQDCALKCQNCRKGFHAVQIPNPPPISSKNGGGEGKKEKKGKEKEENKGKENSFCCWGFFPLGFSMTAWKKQNQARNMNGSSNWVPFSPMFASPASNGGGGFQWFDNSDVNACGPKNVVNKSTPRVYIDDEEEDLLELSESSDYDSSDGDWRTHDPLDKSKKKKRRRRVNVKGRKRGRRPKGNVTKQVNQNVASGGGVSVGGENLEDGSSVQVVFSLAAGAGDKSNSSKAVPASHSHLRKQTRRSVKDVGRLDLNVEFNNDGEEHAATVSAVNGDEDGIENIAFFEGLDEFLSTLPILNVGGDEKAKPS